MAASSDQLLQKNVSIAELEVFYNMSAHSANALREYAVDILQVDTGESVLLLLM